MMKKTILTSLIAIVLLAFNSCSTTQSAVNSATSQTEVSETPVIGSWALTIKGTPIGDVPAQMLVEDVYGTIEATMITKDEKANVKHLEIEGNKISGTFYNQQYNVDTPFSLAINEQDQSKLQGTFMNRFQVVGERKD